MKRILLLSWIVLLLFSCSSARRELRSALRSAGKNRPELERVLDYFSSDGDKQKLNAAEFLIRHLRWHQSYTGDFQNYQEMMDSLIPKMTSAERYNRLMREITDTLKKDFVLREDIKTITGDFLIANINEAFSLWREGRWAKHLTFDEFCEYLLPYKIDELQPLEEWRDEYRHLFLGGEITIDDAIDEYRGEPHIALQNIRGTAKGNVLAYSDSLSTTALFDLRLLKDIPYGDCVSLCDLGLLLYRSKGIPVAMDFVPGWADRAGSHAWLSICTRRGVNIAVHAFSDGDPVDEVQCRRFAKVYRRTFQPNPELARRVSMGYPIPARLGDIFFKDVTEEYVRCEDVTAKVNRFVSGRNVYVAVFDNQRWVPVAYGMKKGLGKAVFNKLARNALYLPVVVKRNGEQVPFGNPFYIHTDGSIETITSPRQKGKRNTVTMCRKYPAYWQLAAVYDRTRGGVIQGSNAPDFREVKDIVEIPVSTAWSGYVSGISDNSFRYYRFCAPSGSKCDLAEIKLYEGDSIVCPQKIVLPSVISRDVDAAKLAEVIVDDDALTWYPTDDHLGIWIGIDCGSLKRITGVYYSVRSDGNDFYPGYEYVLRRWNGSIWETVETFVGTREVKHTFQNLQEGALYLITCITTGTQNRPFLVKEGAVCWL